jgi:hypothetical protein
MEREVGTKSSDIGRRRRRDTRRKLTQMNYNKEACISKTIILALIISNETERAFRFTS